MSETGGNNDWQRRIDHPSSQAILEFIEADLRRGFRLIANAGGMTLPSEECFRELAFVEAEIDRWMACALKRRVPLGRLVNRVIEFIGAAYAIRLAAQGEVH